MSELTLQTKSLSKTHLPLETVRLETENEDLRNRASTGYVGDMFDQSHWMFRRVRRRNRGGLVGALVFGAFMVAFSFALGPWALVAGIAAAIFVVRAVARK